MAKQSTKTYGPSYQVAIDGKRIFRQFERIMGLMADGQWRTLCEIERATGYPQASISAQLRHARKPKFGSYVVLRRRREPWQGQYEYYAQNSNRQSFGPSAQAQGTLFGCADNDAFKSQIGI